MREMRTVVFRGDALRGSGRRRGEVAVVANDRPGLRAASSSVVL